MLCALCELDDLYGELCQLLPGYSWSKEEFAKCYPLHPLIYESASAFRAARVPKDRPDWKPSPEAQRQMDQRHRRANTHLLEKYRP